MKPIRSTLAAVLALAALGPARAQDYPLSIVDDRGKQVTVAARPASVASVSTFGADLLAALGRKVDGLSTLNNKQSAFLGERTAGAVNLGEVHETNLEVLTRLDPDLIIGLRTYTEPFEKKFEEIGTFLAFDLITLDDSLHAIARAAAALGQAAEGEALNAAFLARLDEYAARAPGGVSVVFLWHWADVPFAYYDHHLTPHLLRRLGAANLQGASPTPPPGAPDSAAITLETLISLDPDVIISFKGDDGPFVDHPAWPRLKAVRSGRAWHVGDQYVMPHGPIARDMVLREAAHLLYPAHFPAPDDIPPAARARAMRFAR
ncbi:ABC transporter substrate-binding protein [Thauera linaloolentis]|uniref:ABC transporter periplasmic protein n=1 Tax=Thauera linaloolentis (strain DSM 12138 / JCM 21573 / CCUG 41526 / CIP 105981 / IAM 15112 / NBRC 102519 / 47Lol) TaxID=1123367 RepID=N6Y2A7_THAL4|nr:ABC transporter substrate-binding protein [Thauera linaloolentis]ENO88311.1 ABC transporter periplasmic protein [Thauera linaloolentis 47Lol = DSM 12138]MCM8564479.1 ABC transporter substrate-binding protein [Thauera linaloolentis]